MKHSVKGVHPYKNFNEQRTTWVRKFTSNGNYSGAICSYKHACNCSFYLDNSVFTYVISGSKYMLIDKQEYYLQKGDLLYLPKNTVVFTDIPQATEPFESFNIVLSNQVLQDIPALKYMDGANLRTSAFAIWQSDVVINSFSAFLNGYSFTGKEQLRKQAYEKLLTDIIDSFKNDLFIPGSPAKIKSVDLQRIAGMLTEYMYTPVSVSQMASLCNMSAATFKRKFLQVFGQSPKTWLRQTRLQAAYFHLKTSHERVSEISSFVGFENFAHFSHAFKKYFHIKPSALG